MELESTSVKPLLGIQEKMELESRSLWVQRTDAYIDDDSLSSIESFRLRRSNSSVHRLGSKIFWLPTGNHKFGTKVVGRSKSSRLFLESVPAECAAATIYERLGPDIGCLPRDGVWRTLCRAFSVKVKAGDEKKVVKEVAVAGSKEGIPKEKRRSSWLPDPDRRWPLQGW